MSIWGFARSVLRSFPRRVLSLLAVLVAGSFVEGAGLVLLVPILETAFPGEAEPSAVLTAVAGVVESLGLEFTFLLGLVMFMTVFVGQMGLYLLREQQLAKNLAEVKLWYRERFFKAIFASDWAFFLGQRKGDLINGAFTECSNAGFAFHRYLSLLTSLVLVGVYATAAMMLSWQFTIGMLVLGVVLTLVLQRQIRAGRDIGAARTAANSRFQTVLGESFDAAKLIKGSSLEDRAVDRLHFEASYLAGLEKAIHLKPAVLRAIGETLIVAVLSVAVYLAVEALQLGMAILLTLIYIFFRMFPQIIAAQQTYFQALTFIPGFERVEQLIAEAEARREKQDGTGVRFESLEVGMQLRNISYQYERGPLVVENVSFEIRRGETVGITGSSGAGKSTLADIVLGLLPVTSGQMLIDGRPLEEYDIGTWRRRVGYVSQETFLLHASVRDNLLWGTRPDASQREVEKFARLAHAHDFICDLADGYETVVGDRGVRLSGGQRQRLALARALARTPELLILDEATSALDSESEQRVQAAIESLAGRVTVLVIAHRLSTLASADRIHFLEAGRIAETGTFRELVESRGRFGRLYELQTQDGDSNLGGAS
jgi:ATP-binding cassette subfamily C protein